MFKNIKHKTQIFLALAVQIVILLSMTLYFIVSSMQGIKIRLNIEPMDPRDPLRGDYVTFRYSNLSSIGYTSERFRRGDTIYVPLNNYLGTWTPNTYLAQKTQPLSGTFIKGRVVQTSEEQYNTLESYPQLIVSYGIEEYFIPENAGRNLTFSNAQAEVTLKSDGTALLNKIYINGKPWP